MQSHQDRQRKEQRGHTGVPALSERSSGFGLRQLGPGELQRRFGGWPYGFYAYNVVSSILTVLFSEPRGGIWTIPAELARGRIAAGTIVNVVSSTATTAAIGSFIATRARLWRRLPVERDDQIVFVSLAVIVANAVLSYGYTKDEIMGPAGVFYTLAAFAAVASLLRGADLLTSPKPRSGKGVSGPRFRLGALSLVLAITASGWVVRTAGLHYQMNLMTFYDRNEWVFVDDWLVQQQSSPATGAGKALVQQLREDALEHTTVNPYLLSPRLDQWFR